MPNTKKKRKQILYLGLDPARYVHDGELTHLPIIRIVPRPFSDVEKCFRSLLKFSHFLFTSRTTVEIFVAYSHQANLISDELKKKTCVAVGQASALKLKESGFETCLIAKQETQEGIVPLLDNMDLKGAFIFFPRSSLSRDVIVSYLLDRKIAHETLSLYDTVSNPVPLPDLEPFDEIVFTSPSTVKSFLEICPLPPKEKCRAIGPITEQFLIQNL